MQKMYAKVRVQASKIVLQFVRVILLRRRAPCAHFCLSKNVQQRDIQRAPVQRTDEAFFI